MGFPKKALQFIQDSYVGAKYREGVFVFPALSEETIAVIVDGFLKWISDSTFVEDGKLDIQAFLDFRRD